MRETFQEAFDVLVDPDNVSGAYLSAISGGNVFKVDSDPCEIIKPDSNILDILKKAIELEKNSIIFYIGLKELVGSKSSKKKIESIIQQEQRHIVMLNDRMLEEC
jgi:rubrerythrin